MMKETETELCSFEPRIQRAREITVKAEARRAGGEDWMPAQRDQLLQPFEFEFLSCRTVKECTSE